MSRPDTPSETAEAIGGVEDDPGGEPADGLVGRCMAQVKLHGADAVERALLTTIMFAHMRDDSFTGVEIAKRLFETDVPSVLVLHLNPRQRKHGERVEASVLVGHGARLTLSFAS